MRLALRSRRAWFVLVVLGLCGSVAALAGQNVFQFNAGSSFFNSDKPCPARQIPTFEALIPIPNIFDPFEKDFIPGFCEFSFQKKGRDLKGVKTKTSVRLFVLDNNSGEFEEFDLGTFRTKSNSEGRSSFDFDIPSEIFADGFESGDVSAWSYTRTDFSGGGKKPTDVGGGCGTAASK